MGESFNRRFFPIGQVAWTGVPYQTRRCYARAQDDAKFTDTVQAGTAKAKRSISGRHCAFATRNVDNIW